MIPGLHLGVETRRGISNVHLIMAVDRQSVADMQGSYTFGFYAD